jgi:hypothetical protein
VFVDELLVDSNCRPLMAGGPDVGSDDLLDLFGAHAAVHQLALQGVVQPVQEHRPNVLAMIAMVSTSANATKTISTAARMKRSSESSGATNSHRSLGVLVMVIKLPAMRAISGQPVFRPLPVSARD